MKAFKLFLMALLSISFVAVFSCDDPEVDDDDPETGDGGDADVVDGFIPLTTQCDSTKLCSGVEQPQDCVADFSLGTTQAGYPGIAETGVDGLYDSSSEWYESDYPFVGWYSYNDYSDTGEMLPLKNNVGSEPAEVLNSCAGDADYVLHAVGSGWTTWGVGLGMDWSGEYNPACHLEDGTEDPDSVACWEAYLSDDRISLAEIEELPECSGDDAERKIECATKSKRFKIPRDLSAYRGLGFWIVTTEANEISTMEVHFPIPDTTRWESGPEGCDQESGVATDECYNDFVEIVRLAPSDVGTWVYKEVFFENLAQNPHWGFRFPDDTPFPPTECIGLKLQFGLGEAFDFYIDDITLLR